MVEPSYDTNTGTNSAKIQFKALMNLMKHVFVRERGMSMGLQKLYSIFIGSPFLNVITYLKNEGYPPSDVFCWIIATFLSLLKLNKGFNINTSIVRSLVLIVEVSSQVDEAIYRDLLSKFKSTSNKLLQVRYSLIDNSDKVFPFLIEEFSLIAERLKEVLPTPNTSLQIESMSEYFHTMEAVILIASAFDTSLVSDHSQLTYINDILCLEPQYLIFPSRIFLYISSASGALLQAKQLLLCCEFVTSEQMFSLLLERNANVDSKQDSSETDGDGTECGTSSSGKDLVNDYCETVNSLFNINTKDLIESKIIYSLFERVEEALYCYRRFSGLPVQIHNTFIRLLNIYLAVYNYMYATSKAKFDKEIIIGKCVKLISTILFCQSKIHISIYECSLPVSDLTEALARLLNVPLNYLSQGDKIYTEFENFATTSTKNLYTKISTNIHTLFILLDIVIRVLSENFETMSVNDASASKTNLIPAAGASDSKLSIDWATLHSEVYKGLNTTFKNYLEYCPGPHTDNRVEQLLINLLNLLSTYISLTSYTRLESDTQQECLEFALDSLFTVVQHITNLPSALQSDSKEAILQSLVILTSHDKNVYELYQSLSTLMTQADTDVGAIANVSLLIPITLVLPFLLCKFRPLQSDKMAALYAACLRKYSPLVCRNLKLVCTFAEAMPAMVLAMSSPAQSQIVKSNKVHYDNKPSYYNYYRVSVPNPDHFVITRPFPGQAVSLLELFYFILTSMDSDSVSSTTGDAVMECIIKLYSIVPSDGKYIMAYFNWYLMQLKSGAGMVTALRVQEFLSVLELKHSVAGDAEKNITEAKKIVSVLQSYYSTSKYKSKLIMFDCYGSMLSHYLGKNKSEYVWLVLERILTCFMDTEPMPSIFSALPQKLSIITFECWDDIFCNKIPNFTVELFRTNTDEALIKQFLHNLKRALKLASVEALISEMNPQLISYIVVLSRSEAEKIFHFLQGKLAISISSMISENVVTLYVRLALDSHQKLVDKLEYLKAFCPDITMHLIQAKRQIMDQLSLNVSINPDLIPNSFEYFQGIVSSRGHSSTTANLNYSLYIYAGESLLAVLNSLDSLLIVSSVSQQLVYVYSLSILLASMEPEHINKSHYALMSTLSYFLKHPNSKIFQKSLICWTTFISRLSVSLPLSDPIWPHILVTLNPYVWDDNSIESSDLLDAYTDLFIRLHDTIVNSCTCLANICVPDSSRQLRVTTYRESLLAVIESTALDVRVQHIVACLTHEAMSVRKFSLKCLYALLRTKKSELHKLIFRETYVHSVFTDLFSALMNESHLIKDEEVSELVASCLGTIGAIDPGRLRLKLKRKRMEVSSSQAANVPVNISNDFEMAVRLLTELSSCLLTTSENTCSQQYVGLALQQVLKAYMHNNARLKERISSRLSAQVLAAIQPYFSSKYVYVDSAATADTSQPQSSPKQTTQTLLNVFAEEQTISYTHWLSRMCSRLTVFVVESQAKEIFQACSRLVSRIKPSIGHLLLPYIVVMVLVENRPNSQSYNANYNSNSNKSNSNSSSNNNSNNLFNSVVKEFSYIIRYALSNVDVPNQQLQESSQLKLVLKSIFSVLSFIRPIILIPITNTRQTPKNANSTLSPSPDIIAKLHAFYTSFSLMDLSILAEYCNLYELSLLFLETYLDNCKETSSGIDETISQQLSNLYRSLNDNDSLLGLKSIRTHHSTLKEELLYLQSEKKIYSSIALLEHNITKQPNNKAVHCSLIQTRLLYGFVKDAEMQISYLKAKHSSWRQDLERFEMETCWRLSKWDTLTELLRSSSSSNITCNNSFNDACIGDGDHPFTFGHNSSWEYSIGLLFDYAHSVSEDLFFNQLKASKRSVLFQLGLEYDYTADQAYYISLAKLQMLHEFEECAKLFIFNETIPYNAEEKTRLINSWRESISYMKNSFLVKDQLLAMRRAIISVSSSGMGFDSNISQLWLESATLCRKSGLHEISEKALLLADSNDLDSCQKLKLSIEIAKSVYVRSSQVQAMKQLEAILEHSKSLAAVGEENMQARNEIINRAELKFVKWNSRLNFYDSDKIIKKFEELTSRPDCSEDALYHLGEYCYRLYSLSIKNYSNHHHSSTSLASKNASTIPVSHSKSKNSININSNDDNINLPSTQTPSFNFIKRCLEAYLKSLTLGNKFQFNAIRKAIPLWLDTTEEFCSHRGSKVRSPENADAVASLNAIVERFLVQIPPFKFYIVFSSILFHCLHPDDSTYELMKNIMRIVINAFPVQSLWMMVGTLNSSERGDRAKQVFSYSAHGRHYSSSVQLSSDVLKIHDKINVFIKTMRLFPEPKKSYSTISELNPNLMRLTSETFFNDFHLLLPIEYCFKYPIESSGISNLSNTNLPHFVKFENSCTKISSAMLPLKFDVLASDGKKYGLLYKTREDLRIDSRIMEIFWELNNLLYKDPQCRKRELHIQTYSATFFSEFDGLIEWVDNLKSLREILTPIYKLHHRGCSRPDLEKYSIKCKNPAISLSKTNSEVLSKYSPPLMHEWFAKEFSNPVDWYSSRLTFIRSCAVMSMVGFVIGLGDRHADNILINNETGHVVHVDYAVIFDRGLTLPVPENVPFRLTHNIIDGMGVLGVEGGFRHCCELTLSLLRKEKDKYFYILRNLFNDLRVTVKSFQSNKIGINCVENRTNGLMDQRKCSESLNYSQVSLSVEGQVAAEINNAMNPELLLKMYFGWSIYL